MLTNFERHYYEMLLRVRDFSLVRDSANFFPDGSLGGETISIIKAEIENISRFAIAKSSSVGDIRVILANKTKLSAKLRADMAAINRTAYALAFDIPNLHMRFPMPRSNGVIALLATARSFASSAAPLVNEFVQHYLPADFLDSLNAEIEEFDRLLIERDKYRSNKITSKAAIAQSIKRARKAVKRLDVIIKNKFSNDLAVLAAWKRAKHVERAARAHTGETPESESESQA